MKQTHAAADCSYHGNHLLIGQVVFGRERESEKETRGESDRQWLKYSRGADRESHPDGDESQVACIYCLRLCKLESEHH